MSEPPIVAREHGFAARRVEVEGVGLSVVDQGQPRRGTLLFLHGNPAWSFLWRKLLRAGLDAGFRVVAPDMAGFGRSDKPLDPAYHTLERHIANLEAVARALDLRDLTLVLHDWGGPVGMGLAVRQPDRVARIVAANTTAFAPRKPRALSAWHRVMGSSLGYSLGVPANLVPRSAFRYGVRKPLAPEVREAYLWPFRERGARVAAARMVQLVPDGPAHPTAATLRVVEEHYPALRGKPMLVLWADRDPVMTPRLAERWGKDFPHAEVRHVSQGGHFWQEDDPDAFLGPLLAFAQGNASSKAAGRAS